MGKCIIIKKITSKVGGGVSESVQNQVHTIDYISVHDLVLLNWVFVMFLCGWSSNVDLKST